MEFPNDEARRYAVAMVLREAADGLEAGEISDVFAVAIHTSGQMNRLGAIARDRERAMTAIRLLSEELQEDIALKRWRQTITVTKVHDDGTFEGI